MSTIRQLLLPREGGGPLRRFFSMRERLFRDQWNDNRPLRGPVPLFDFRRRDDEADAREALRPDRNRGLFGGWRTSDDGVIGGYSKSRMEFVEGELRGDDASPPSSPPFLRWSGTLSTQINRQSELARNVTRSGFAAVLSPEFPFGAPLGNKYKALEICCRADERTYAVNLHVETYFPEDMYQGFIVGGGQQVQQTNSGLEQFRHINNSKDSTRRQGGNNEELPEQSLDVRQHIQNQQAIAYRADPNNHPYYGHPSPGFQRFILPFKELALTSRGRMRHQQRVLDGDISIESIGFTLMDGKDGDFCFDLVSVRAVNLMQGEVVGTIEEDEKEEELHRSLRSERIKKEEDDDSKAEKPNIKS